MNQPTTHKSSWKHIFSFLIVLLIFFSSYYIYVTQNLQLENLPVISGEVLRADDIDSTLNFESRPLVETRTTWNAPIIWEGMFDPTLYDQKHKKDNITVALTVFAVGRYLDAYLKTFLISAEKHFMPGLPVMYYVLTDLPEKMPKVNLAAQRNIKLIKVEMHSRWQDISMMRMKTLSELIESDIRHCCPYVFCFDVDQVFKGRFGSEVLGDSVALLHAHYYKLPKDMFTYDRNPKSKACMMTGDYYYHAAIFGGLWRTVRTITETCYLNIMEDKLNNVEALWHDESHLNKYYLMHKPTKLLSPEYCWDESIGNRNDIHVTRLIWAPKHYDTLRPES
ncbi:N-acetyllactosaminide alpha-1,3-galactosyltransferase-like isoform X2 [Genypterus blacodes]|uniref:N-acetyllactosaminide alpha-1,3-galactosyltransferase-like isoform X2 n=1 Tax=Genypterus blacodes TaxID=154954 RepID=UPI003F7592C2